MYDNLEIVIGMSNVMFFAMYHGRLYIHLRTSLTSAHFFSNNLEHCLNIFVPLRKVCSEQSKGHTPWFLAEISSLIKLKNRARKRADQSKLIKSSRTNSSLLYVKLSSTIYRLLLLCPNHTQHLLLSCGPVLMVSSIYLLHQQRLMLISLLMC